MSKLRVAALQEPPVWMARSACKDQQITSLPVGRHATIYNINPSFEVGLIEETGW